MLVLIKGAGDLASGIALRLHHARFDVVMTDIAYPTAVRRTVAFCQAIIDGKTMVEDITAVLAKNTKEIKSALDQKMIPVLVDPDARMVQELTPEILVDAIMAKKNLGTKINDAPVVIAIGPGFTAGADCYAVIETKRGHTLGRVITASDSEPNAIPNTGIPGDINGFTTERLIRAPADGVFEGKVNIGDRVQKGDLVGMTAGRPVRAEIDGIVRGLLPSGIPVTAGMKSGDIDPRCEKFHCFTVSDKALSIAGGVLEAILRFHKPRE
ncbi:molybdenum hydroxylase [Spirochaetia bacterium]|nr:molybdenum hydroxylase [Spirochaetia bacterium]